jgi:hypothetical protein
MVYIIVDMVWIFSFVCIFMYACVCIAVSDGDLLTMADVDITSLAKSGKKLFNAPDDTMMPSSADVKEVYSRGWVKKQRVALKRRLGVETAQQQRRDVSVATKFVSTKELLRRTDVVKETTPWGEREREEMLFAEESTAAAEGSERESWFVRLFRFVVIG